MCREMSDEWHMYSMNVFSEWAAVWFTDCEDVFYVFLQMYVWSNILSVCVCVCVCVHDIFLSSLLSILVLFV